MRFGYLSAGCCYLALVTNCFLNLGFVSPCPVNNIFETPICWYYNLQLRGFCNPTLHPRITKSG
jgi:hypothetical protein